ncbi:hypothetical protein L9F63_023426, partial [Diploptera punctata]
FCHCICDILNYICEGVKEYEDYIFYCNIIHVDFFVQDEFHNLNGYILNSFTTDVLFNRWSKKHKTRRAVLVPHYYSLIIFCVFTGKFIFKIRGISFCPNNFLDFYFLRVIRMRNELCFFAIRNKNSLFGMIISGRLCKAVFVYFTTDFFFY